MGSTADKAPWESIQFVSELNSFPIKPALLYEGWQEIPHDTIVTAKNRISDTIPSDEWEIRKKITNPYEAVFSGEDTQFPSLANVQPLSRSYFKMIEILHISDFFTTANKKPFISAHVCEGPGGFIQAVVERLTTDKIPAGGVYAMTLKPTKSHIPGWRRSIHFLKKYPHIHLEYGEDETGNILRPENQASFCAKARGAQLFTADGGFDFSVNYTNQELMAFPLLLASFTMGLQSLAVGGTMVIKLFDIYGTATQDLFLGTATFFSSFTLYKPATSRPCNSERYFIAKGYLGSVKAAKWIANLQQAQLKYETSPFLGLGQDHITHLVEKNTWPQAVLDAVNEQIKWQETLQITTITETIQLQKDDIANKMLVTLQKSRKWCEVFGVKM